MDAADLSKGDQVRVKGLAGTGKVLDLWYQAGAGILVKIGWYRPRSGRFIRATVEPIANVTR